MRWVDYGATRSKCSTAFGLASKGFAQKRVAAATRLTISPLSHGCLRPNNLRRLPSPRFVYPSIAGLEISCERWIPHDEESLVVTYDFRQMPGPGTGAPRTDGATLPVVLLIRTDLQGVWLSERLGWQDGLDQAAILDEAGSERGLVHAWDDPFHAVIGPSQGTRVARCQIGHELWGPEITHGQGISIAYSIDLPVDDLGRASLTFVVSSSSESKEQALATWTRVSERIAG